MLSLQIPQQLHRCNSAPLAVTNDKSVTFSRLTDYYKPMGQESLIACVHVTCRKKCDAVDTVQGL